MKKFAQVAGAVLLLVALVLIAAAVAVHVLLPPAKAKALLEKKIAATLHREVKLGEVAVGLFSGLSVSNFALSQAPTFADGTFVSSDKLRVRVAWLPLLKKKVVITELGLMKPAVTVIRYANGAFNFSDLTGTSPAQIPAPVGTEKPNATNPGTFNVIVTGAKLTGGVIRFDDRLPGGRSATIDPIDLSVKNFSLLGSADVQTTLTASTKELKANVDFAGTVNVFKPGVNIKRFTLTSGGSSIAVAGEARELTTQPRLDVTVTVASLLPALMNAFAPLPENVKWTGPASGTIKAQGTRDDMAVDADIDLSNAALTSPGIFSKPAKTALTITAAVELKQLSTLMLKQLRVTMASMQLNATGQVNAVLTSTRTFALAFATNKLDLAPLQALLAPGAMAPGLRLQGPAALSAEVNGTTTAGKLSATFEGVDVKLSYGDSFLKPAGTAFQIKTSGRYATPTALDLPTLTLVLGPMILNGKATYASGKTVSAYTAALASNEFALGPVAALSPTTTSYAPSGFATIVADIRSAAPEPLIKGKFTLRDGAARYEASELKQLVTAATFTNSSVDMPSLRGKLNGADMNVSMTAKNIRAHPVVRADITLAELDLDKLLPKTPPTSKQGRAPIDWNLVTEAEAAPTPPPAAMPVDLAGTFKAAKVKHLYMNAADLNVTWDLKDVTAALDTVSGAAKLRQGKGEFRNIQALTESSRYARLLFLPLTLVQKLDKATGGQLKLPAMDRVTYKLVTGDYTFLKGVMTIDKFLLNADLFDAGLTGTIGLAGKQPLNCKATMTLSSGITLPLTVAGTAAAPAVSLDKKETGKQVIEAIKGGAADKFLKKLGLPGLAHPAEPTSAPAESQPATSPTSSQQTAPASESQPDPVKEVGNLLRGLLKKH